MIKCVFVMLGFVLALLAPVGAGVAGTVTGPASSTVGDVAIWSADIADVQALVGRFRGGTRPRSPTISRAFRPPLRVPACRRRAAS
jgi:hypothetical protein